MEIWNLEDFLVFPTVSIFCNYFLFVKAWYFVKFSNHIKTVSSYYLCFQCFVLSSAKYISPFYLLWAEVLTPLCDFSTSNSELRISKLNHCNYLSSWKAAGGVKAKLICTFSPFEWVFENQLLRTLNLDSAFLDPLIVWDNWGRGNFTYFSETPNHGYIFIRILIESYRVGPQGWSAHQQPQKEPEN